MKIRLLLLLCSIGFVGCSSSVDDKNGSNGNNRNNQANNINNQNAANLTALEWSMIGTWRSCEYPNDRCRYYIIEPDRHVCSFMREGENFGQRFDEVHFQDWKLLEDTLDDEGRIDTTKTLISTGEVWDQDRYGTEEDRMYWFWMENDPFPMAWVNNIIPCSASNINSIASDITRLGVLGNGDTSDTRLDGDANNQNNVVNPTNNNSNGGNNSNNTTGPVGPGG